VETKLHCELTDSEPVLVEQNQVESVAVERSHLGRTQEERNLVERKPVAAVHSEQIPSVAVVHSQSEDPVAYSLSLHVHTLHIGSN